MGCHVASWSPRETTVQLDEAVARTWHTPARREHKCREPLHACRLLNPRVKVGGKNGGALQCHLRQQPVIEIGATIGLCGFEVVKDVWVDCRDGLNESFKTEKVIWVKGIS